MTVLLEHLDNQLRSSQRLLQVLLAQGDSIRKQDVEGVLARLGDVQTELANRERLERDRDGILRQAATQLGVAPDTVTLEDILKLVPATEGDAARAKSAELKGLLSEVARVHGHNRVLIRQELSFLDHLMRVLSGEPQGGYTQTGYASNGAPKLATLDTRA